MPGRLRGAGGSSTLRTRAATRWPARCVTESAIFLAEFEARQAERLHVVGADGGPGRIERAVGRGQHRFLITAQDINRIDLALLYLHGCRSGTHLPLPVYMIPHHLLPRIHACEMHDCVHGGRCGPGHTQLTGTNHRRR